MTGTDDIGKLVITRLDGQSFFIGDDIEVRLYFAPNRGNQIRVAITAPKSIRVMRAELKDQPSTH